MLGLITDAERAFLPSLFEEARSAGLQLERNMIPIRVGSIYMRGVQTNEILDKENLCSKEKFCSGRKEQSFFVPEFGSL